MKPFAPLLAACFALALLPRAHAQGAGERVAGSGLYAIWYGHEERLLQLPFISGGQIVLQWAQLEPCAGVYDFRQLDSALAAAAKRSLSVTVQVNGNQKPAYLYTEVAVHPRKLSVQVRDPQGTLQFWDPRYLDRYTHFIDAFGQHLSASPLRAAVAAVRLNYNPIGTEHYFRNMGPEGTTTAADEDYHSYRPAPDGHRYEQSFNDSLLAGYLQAVLRAYLQAFRGIRLLARYDGLMPGRGTGGTELKAALEAGRIGLFQTNSDARHAHNAKAQLFFDYCRSGKTTGYAEPFSDAEGHHGGQQTHFPQAPATWNYWRLLGDLDAGISWIALYGADLRRDSEPEFHDAFRFAADYAGYHRAGASAPGAWVALRSGESLDPARVTTGSGPLETLSFLMRETSGRGRLLANVGPPGQRYGAWARLLSDGDTLRFAVDQDFAASLRRADSVLLRVVYLDSTTGSWQVAFDNGMQELRQTIVRRNTEHWQTEILTFPCNDFSGADGSIRIAGSGVLHLVELRKKAGAPAGDAGRKNEAGIP